jgi:hypothetical protein
MTTDISTQSEAAAAAATDEIQIVRTPPTVEDAQLILQQQIVMAMNGANQGYDLLWAFETPPTLGQLRKRHPRESAEYQQVMAFLVACETTATFVRQGILNEALVSDLYDVAGAYRRIEKITKGIRKETGQPRIGENTEWLAKRATD